MRSSYCMSFHLQILPSSRVDVSGSGSLTLRCWRACGLQLCVAAQSGQLGNDWM